MTQFWFDPYEVLEEIRRREMSNVVSFAGYKKKKGRKK